MMQVEGLVYVLDDDRQLLSMLDELLTSVGCEVASFDNAEAFLAACDPYRVACLLCDIRMPGMTGLQVQRRLQEIAPEMPVVFMTGFAEVAVAVDAMKHGAHDFIQKPFSSQALLDTLFEALRVARERRARVRREAALEARVALLTPRERSIARRVVEGASSSEISTEFGISVRTVENHRAHIMDKLRVRSVADLVRVMLAAPE